MPPRGWRPAGRIPVIRGILGLTFGSAINISLDYLLSSGYNVDGYTNDIVYLRNVSAMNYVWTDGALFMELTDLTHRHSTIQLHATTLPATTMSTIHL